MGAGGNAGNQAAVLVIRGLATGEISSLAPCAYIMREARMAFGVSLIMVCAGYARVVGFGYSAQDAVAISASLFAIVFISIVAGAMLPLALHRCRVDPAHAGATIQAPAPIR